MCFRRVWRTVFPKPYPVPRPTALDDQIQLSDYLQELKKMLEPGSMVALDKEKASNIIDLLEWTMGYLNHATQYNKSLETIFCPHGQLRIPIPPV